MNIDRESLYYWPLFLAKCGGLHPEDTSIWHRIRYVFLCISTVPPLILAVYGIYIHFNDDLDFVVDAYQTIVLLIHMFSKHSIWRFNQTNISKLITQSARFWPIDNFNGAIRKECGEFLRKVQHITTIHITIGLLVMVSFFLQPFFTGKPMVTLYVPNGWDLSINILYYYLGYQSLCSNFGMDTLFLSICMAIVVQFKLLRYEFTNYNFNKSKSDDLRTLINYHAFLLDYCSDIRRVANFICFLQFSITQSACCLCLYTILGDFSAIIKLRSVIYIIGQTVQTALYCSATDFLSEAATEIADAIYQSNWYQSDELKDRKCLILAIARAQKPLIFSAYGFVEMNLQTFVVVMKAAFSFYTYLTTIRDQRA